MSNKVNKKKPDVPLGKVSIKLLRELVEAAEQNGWQRDQGTDHVEEAARNLEDAQHAMAVRLHFLEKRVRVLTQRQVRRF